MKGGKTMKIDSGKMLTVAIAVAGLVSTILSSKKDDADRATMKKELKEEILSEISNQN
jgi:hypothetical protein